MYGIFSSSSGDEVGKCIVDLNDFDVQTGTILGGCWEGEAYFSFCILQKVPHEFFITLHDSFVITIVDDVLKSDMNKDAFVVSVSQLVF